MQAIIACSPNQSKSRATPRAEQRAGPRSDSRSASEQVDVAGSIHRTQDAGGMQVEGSWLVGKLRVGSVLVLYMVSLSRLYC